METLCKNITNVYGARGQVWLARLPKIIDELADLWGLCNLTPVENMTFNYVAKGITHAGDAIILKISCDAKTMNDEKKALKNFDGNASVQLLDYEENLQALLLQQATPGISLKSIYTHQTEFVMDVYIATMKKLHASKINIAGHKHIRDWLSAFDRVTAKHLPEHLLIKAITLKDKLLVTSSADRFLHGDLHHDNVIQHNNHWIAIDPKGIVGESEFELAAFDFIHNPEMLDASTLKKLFSHRVEMIASKANLNSQRIKDWVFVRLMLMAAWQMEDNIDATKTLNYAEIMC